MNDHRLWLLRLVPQRRHGRLLTGAVILIVLLGWFWQAGIFQGPARGSGAAAFFAVILAYIVPVFHYITERTRHAFDELAPHLDADVGQIDRWRRGIDHKSARWIVTNLALGITAWIAHTILLTSGTAAVSSLRGAAWFAILTGPAFVWIVMTCVVHALIDNARLFKHLARYVRIDLLNPAPLTAFARVAVISTLAIIGAQAAFPIMLIDPAGAAAAAIPGLVVTSGALAVLFVLPIWPIHREIVAVKRKELGRVNALLGNAVGDDHDEARRIAYLNPYLVYRREIAAVHEWPFDTGITTRLAFYLIIPPLTWLGAALIDVAVERFV